MFLEYCGAILVAVLVFIGTERFPWHRPSVEFFFWLFVLQASAAVAALAPDSPVRYFVTVNESKVSLAVIFGLVVPLSSAFVVQSFFNASLTSYQEHRSGDLQQRIQESQQLSRQADLDDVAAAAANPPGSPGGGRRRRQSSVYDATVVNESDFIARSKQVYVDNVLERLIYSSDVRRFAAWVRGHIAREQASIEKVLKDATPAELNHIVENVNVPKLLRYANSGHAVDNVLVYIMDERSTELTTIARAAILHALMRTQSLPFISQEMRWAVALFQGAKGEELTLLKNMLDSSGDFNNLFKLIFTDIADAKLRRKMLRHIEAESAQIRADLAAAGRHVPLKILSDVDDTLYCSGGNFPAGFDKRYPKHELYPGVLALFNEIDAYARARASESGGGLEPEREPGSSSKSGKGSAAASRVTVAVLAPWKQGGKVFEMECASEESVRSIQDTVQAKYNITPPEQKLVITSSKDQGRANKSHKAATSMHWNDGNLVFVSARPHVWKDVAENGSYRRFHHLVNAGKMHAVPTMLTGSLYTGTLAVWLRLFDHFKNFLMDFLDAMLAFLSSLPAALVSGVSRKSSNKSSSGSGSSSGKSKSKAAGLSWGARRRRSVRRESKRREANMGVGNGLLEAIDEALPEASMRIDDEDYDDDADTDTSLAAAVLSRSVSSFGNRRIGNNNWEAVGRTKVGRMERYARLYPEYDLVFFGDNAQGDLFAAELLSENNNRAGHGKAARLQCTFIHKVQSNTDSSLLSAFAEDKREKEWDKRGILFFETYMEAATLAKEKGLISAHGLHRVGLAVHDELLELFIRHPRWDWELVFSQSKRDIRRANKLLKPDGLGLQIPVPILPYKL